MAALAARCQPGSAQQSSAVTPNSRSRCRAVPVRCQQVNKGFSVLEWTSKLVPQGSLVTGALPVGQQQQ